MSKFYNGEECGLEKSAQKELIDGAVDLVNLMQDQIKDLRERTPKPEETEKEIDDLRKELKAIQRKERE